MHERGLSYLLPPTARQKEVEAAVNVMERFHNEQGW